MKQQNQQEFIIFLHLMKVGGMTLQRLLRRKYGESFITKSTKVARHIISKGGQEKKDTSLEASFRLKTMKDRYAAGHFCFGAHQFLPKPSTYITILRHPIKRLISLYYYSRINPDAFYCKQANEHDLTSFLLECKLHEMDNGMVRFIVGSEDDRFINRTSFGECSREMLEEAKSNLTTYFSAVGVTERFDESLLLLSDALGWDDCRYLRLNEGKKPPKAEQLPDDIMAELALRNELDIELYQWVLENHKQRVAALGEPFQDRLRKFQEANRLYNERMIGIYNFYDNAKSQVKRVLKYAGSQHQK